VKKFQFSLEPLAKVRSLAVRQREVALARAQEALADAEARRLEKEEELRQALNTAPRGAIVQVRELLEMDAERRRLRGQLRHAEQQLVRSSGAVEDERSHLLDARRDEKVVGKLRERRYFEYIRDLLRHEQKALDEVASRGTEKRRAA
jgi:flagellar protein FliJ